MEALFTPMFGRKFTFTNWLSVSVHPFASVAVTVYNPSVFTVML